MRGIVLVELREYAEEVMGPGAWVGLLDDAHLPARSYKAADSYPDEEVFALVLAASRAWGESVSTVLEDFGRRRLAPGLARTYASLLRPRWRTLDLLEHTEGIIHTAVRAHDPLAAPPRLVCFRVAEDRVRISYRSERQLCALARGIVHGVADLYEETVTVEDEQCMLKGDPACELVVSLVTTAAPG